MGWEIILEELGALVERDLESYFDELIEEERAYHPFMEELYTQVRGFILRRGKRLASCSTLLVYEGYTNRLDDQIIKVAVGVELYRHAILIHDDIMDQDTLRRGKKTLHRVLEGDYNPEFGIGVSLFAGNIVYTMAHQSILRSGFPHGKINRVAHLFAEGYHAVNESQVLDLLFEYKTPSIREWYTMASKRAASLFKASLLIGAILADAPENDIQLLRKAAEQIGYSFDIQDDIIDTFASKEQYGRKPGGDLLKNKKPLHIVYTYQLATQQQLKAMNNAIINYPNDLC